MTAVYIYIYIYIGRERERDRERGWGIGEMRERVHNFTTVRTDRLHKAGGGLITIIGDNITFTTTDIHSTINTHNTELQMVKEHMNNTKHITIAIIYIPPRDSTSTRYKQLTKTYNTAYSTSQTFHTQYSPEM